MMPRQLPQLGDVAATRVQDQAGAADREGPVLAARRDEPQQSEETDLSNVIPFARPRRHGAAAPFPLPSVAPNERPAPHTTKFGVGRSIALVAGSLALHSALLAMLWHPPGPMASIGVESMTVEIVLGATTAAGLATTPGEQEVQAVVPSEARTQEEPTTEQSRATTAMPQEAPVAAQETAPEVRPEEKPPEAQIVEPKPEQSKPEATVAEAPAETQPVERPPEPTEPPQVQTMQKAPERKRVDAPTDKKAAQKKQLAATPPTDASSGVGRGRSDNSSTYEGKVVAHVSRHQRFTPSLIRVVNRLTDARNVTSKFIVTLEYEIDGEGRVTSINVRSSSGNEAVDRAAIAVVRQASPVPRPPDGKPRKFIQPISYNQKIIYR